MAHLFCVAYNVADGKQSQIMAAIKEQWEDRVCYPENNHSLVYIEDENEAETVASIYNALIDLATDHGIAFTGLHVDHATSCGLVMDLEDTGGKPVSFKWLDFMKHAGEDEVE